jgi:hypothetical protein
MLLDKAIQKRFVGRDANGRLIRLAWELPLIGPGIRTVLFFTHSSNEPGIAFGILQLFALDPASPAVMSETPARKHRDRLLCLLL